MSTEQAAPRRRIVGSIGRTAAIVFVTAAVVAPTTALANHVFDDVADDDVHALGIEWASDNGITAGCGDGSGFCPSDPVTRAQMATFMHRLSGHAGGVDASVDAATLNGMTAAELAGPGSAGVHLDAGVIDRAFSSVVPSVLPTIESASAEGVEIDMGSDMTERIVVCSVDTNAVATRDAVCTVSTPSGNTVRVRVWDPSDGAYISNAAEVFVGVIG